MRALIEYFRQHLPIAEREVDFLQSTLSTRRYEKREAVHSSGTVTNAFYFVESGFVRLFYLTEKGEEKTAYFYGPGRFISDYESYLRESPSRMNLQATETTELVVITRVSAEKLLGFSSAFSQLAMLAMESELITYQRMIASLLTLTPEERYVQLLEENPEIFQKVPQLQIASFIGVQPESLSRIKQRIQQS